MWPAAAMCRPALTRGAEAQGGGGKLIQMLSFHTGRCHPLSRFEPFEIITVVDQISLAQRAAAARRHSAE